MAAESHSRDIEKIAVNTHEEKDRLRFYRRLLIAIFLVVEAYVLGLNLYYRIAENDSWRSVMFNFLSSTALTAFVIGLSYYFLWRTITSLQESRKRYRALSEELQRSNTELAVYANTVSHDLKGPVTTMLTSVYSMKEILDKPLTAETIGAARELSEIALRGAMRGNALIEELLALAGTDQPRQPEDVEVSDIVEEILKENSEELERKGIRFAADDDLGHVLATPLEVYQVFSNLITNAISYGGSDIEVNLLSSEAENSYVVRDNGPGVPEDMVQQVFKPLVKGESGRTGIGLAIVEKIIDSYGGSISVYNDNGARFEFTLKNAIE